MGRLIVRTSCQLRSGKSARETLPPGKKDNVQHRSGISLDRGFNNPRVALGWNQPDCLENDESGNRAIGRMENQGLSSHSPERDRIETSTYPEDWDGLGRAS
jgi:hypothetical protein